MKTIEVGHQSSNRLSGAEKDKLRKKFGTNRLSGAQKDTGRRAKHKALMAKVDAPKGKDIKR